MRICDDEKKKLNYFILQLNQSFAKIGIVCVREYVTNVVSIEKISSMDYLNLFFF